MEWLLLLTLLFIVFQATQPEPTKRTVAEFDEWLKTLPEQSGKDVHRVDVYGGDFGQ